MRNQEDFPRKSNQIMAFIPGEMKTKHQFIII